MSSTSFHVGNSVTHSFSLPSFRHSHKRVKKKRFFFGGVCWLDCTQRSNNLYSRVYFFISVDCVDSGMVLKIW